MLAFYIVLLVYPYLKPKKKTKSLATKKFGEFATPADNYLRAPTSHPAVDAGNYEIKPHFLTLVQQN
jgi:hypothetical protein